MHRLVSKRCMFYTLGRFALLGKHFVLCCPTLNRTLFSTVMENSTSSWGIVLQVFPSVKYLQCHDRPTIYVTSFFFLSSLIKSRLGVEACNTSFFIYGKRCVCTAGLVLWLFWSSFIRGCSIFISAVSPLFCLWIAPIHFCLPSEITIKALPKFTFVREIIFTICC